MLPEIPFAPADPILGLMEAYRADRSPQKVNLAVGIYQDEHGRTPILASVKEAERRLLETEVSKSYLPIGGELGLTAQVEALVLGEGHPALAAGRVRTVHAPGGTGALRVGGELLAKVAGHRRVWLSRPTWPNHPGVFKACGLEVREYPYLAEGGRVLDFEGMCAALDEAGPHDAVVLHGCCHNPTGVDFSPSQWRALGALAECKGWTPFVDLAYLGFAEGLQEDRAGVLALAERVPAMLVAVSFSKNFGLYAERVGALMLMAPDSAQAEAALSHTKAVIRVLYSNPPAHGGRIVAEVLGDKALRGQWEAELAAMRNRLRAARRAFAEGLRVRGVRRDLSFVETQRGLFSYLALTDEQVARLRERSVYVVQGGRINVAGIAPGNLEYVCDAFAWALA